MPNARIVLSFLVLATVSLLTACGGGSTTTTTDGSTPQVSVTVSPSGAISVDQGGSIQFTAVVNGTSNHQVTWTIQEGSAGGSINASGLYTAPATVTTVHVIATSAADPTKAATATVTVNAVSVSIQPDTIGIKKSTQRQLAAVVTGTVLNTSVIWTIQEAPAGGAINGSGLYTAPATGGPFHVTATSVADPTKSATATVVLADAGFRSLSTSTLEPRIRHTATLLPNGKVLLAGGGSPVTDEILDSAELFDPTTETFSATGSMSQPRWLHTATLLNDGTVLITGGGGDAQQSAEIYDPATGAFTQVGSMTVGRADHTASLLADGRVLLAGGFADSGFDVTDTTEIYDPATQSFSTGTAMPAFVAWHTASVLLDGTVFTAGGIDGCNSVADAARFDPGGNSFDPTASLEVPRALHTATTLNSGRVLLAGGSAFDDCEVTTVFATAVVFDPATSTYSAPLSMREARERHSATLLLDGTVLVVGQTAELFDPAAFSFVITGDPAASGVDRRATRLADGRVLLTGGTALAEIYE